jgi:hypothetical protein
MVKINEDIKISLWEDTDGFFNPEITFNKQDADKFSTCLLKKNDDTQNRVLLLCLTKASFQTYGIDLFGTFLDKDTFIPESPFIKLEEFKVKTK